MRLLSFGWSKVFLLGINLLVFLLLGQWVTENISIHRLIDYMSQISPLAIAGAFTIYLATLVFYGMRMSLLLNHTFLPSFLIVNLGYALNTFTPLRLGEAIKIYLANRLFLIRITALFSASIAEKLIDVFKLLVLGAFVGIIFDTVVTSRNMLVSTLILVTVAVTGITLLRLYIVPIVRMLPKKNRLRRALIELHKHGAVYPMSKILAITFGIWMLNIYLVYFSFNNFLPTFGLSIAESATLFLILAIAVALPSAPASIGLFEAGVVVFLQQREAISSDAALAVATIFHLVIVLPPIAFTGLLLLSRGLSGGGASR